MRLLKIILLLLFIVIGNSVNAAANKPKTPNVIEITENKSSYTFSWDHDGDRVNGFRAICKFNDEKRRRIGGRNLSSETRSVTIERVIKDGDIIDCYVYAYNQYGKSGKAYSYNKVKVKKPKIFEMSCKLICKMPTDE